MNLSAINAAKDIPILYLLIGCILMAILGGFTSEFNAIVSVRQFFGVIIRSIFIGLIAFLGGLSVKIPWYIKLMISGLFGFIGIPSIMFLARKLIAVLTTSFEFVDKMLVESQNTKGGKPNVSSKPRRKKDDITSTD